VVCVYIYIFPVSLSTFLLIKNSFFSSNVNHFRDDFVGLSLQMCQHFPGIIDQIHSQSLFDEAFEESLTYYSSIPFLIKSEQRLVGHSLHMKGEKPSRIHAFSNGDLHCGFEYRLILATLRVGDMLMMQTHGKSCAEYAKTTLSLFKHLKQTNRL
jgi:hypothetical protein